MKKILKGPRALYALWLPLSAAWAGAWAWHFRIASCSWTPTPDGLLGWFCVPRPSAGGWVSLASLDYVAAITLGVPLLALVLLMGALKIAAVRREISSAD